MSVAVYYARTGREAEALAVVAQLLQRGPVEGHRLADLAAHLSPAGLQELFAGIDIHRTPQEQLAALGGLAAAAPEPFLRSMLAAAHTIGDSNAQTEAIAYMLVEQIALGLAEEAAAYAKTIAQMYPRVGVVVHRLLKERHVLADQRAYWRRAVLDSAVAITNAFHSVHDADLGSGDEVPAAEQTRNDPIAQVQLLVWNSKDAQDGDRAAVLDEVRTLLARLEPTEQTTDRLRQLAHELARAGLIDEALTVAAGVRHRSLRVLTVLRLIDYLHHPEQLRAALAIAHSVTDDRWRHRVVAPLAALLVRHHLTEAALEQAMRLPERDWSGEYPRALTLAQIAEALAVHGRRSEGLAVARSIARPY